MAPDAGAVEADRERERRAAEAREQIDDLLDDGGGCAELMDALAALRDEPGDTDE